MSQHLAPPARGADSVWAAGPLGAGRGARGARLALCTFERLSVVHLHTGARAPCTYARTAVHLRHTLTARRHARSMHARAELSLIHI
eukprot:12778119-Alexandrium_andersonii.AAC.1